MWLIARPSVLVNRLKRVHGFTKKTRSHFADLGRLRFLHQLKLVRHSGELAQRPGFHLARQITAMDFHRSLADAKISGNLLAEAAAHDVDHNFTFSRA
jgi:hypothetical protein